MTESLMTGDQMFELAFPLIWREENGSVSQTNIVASDYQKDPGGYTRGGIALNEHPEMTKEQLDAMIYEDFYSWYKENIWRKANCDLLPWPLALIVFDGEVNEGSRGVAALQEALGVTADGIIGPHTITALVRYSDKTELAAFTLGNRDAYYRTSKNFALYGRGWIKRLFIVALSTGGPA